MHITYRVGMIAGLRERKKGGFTCLSEVKVSYLFSGIESQPDPAIQMLGAKAGQWL